MGGFIAQTYNVHLVVSRSAHVHTINKPHWSLFRSAMRSPPSKGLGPIVLVHTQVRLLSSYLNKRTKVQFKQIKHSR